jgi:F-type H+-transporting ATPase subunit b
METLGRFGLDPILLAAQVVNFLIIAFVLYRFLLRPLLATMKARGEKIAQGLEDAEKARGALAEAAKEREKIIQEASAQAFRMLEGARGEADRLRAAAMEKAGKDAERLIEQSRDRIALERQEMEKAVQGLSLELSGEILAKVVGELFSDEEKARVLARGIERIRRSGAA